MNRIRALAAITALATFACTTKDTTTNSVGFTTPPTPTFSSTYTLQGFVADATTGARIGGTDLQLFLIEGATVRGPTRLNNGATDPLIGEFAFAGIPIDYNDTNKTYKVVAIKPGYQRFESEISNWAAMNNAPDHLDAVYNMIGNIFLFPLAATSPRYAFTVTYNGKPVPGATVLLDPAPNSNDPTFNTGSALGSTTAYLASLSATTDANGVAAFPGANLALGAAYKIQVLPVTFTETSGTVVQLARYDNATNLIVGVSDVDQRIALADVITSIQSLFVVNASNFVTGAINTNGTLVITLSAPATLRNADGFDATVAGTTPTFGVPRVSANLSTDGRTLTLTPNFTTPPIAGAQNVTITYTNGTALIEAVDYPGVARSVFPAGGTNPLTFSPVVGAAAANVNPTVMMRAP